MSAERPALVMLRSRTFVLACGVTAVALLILGRVWTPPPWLLAAEIFATIIGLFVFGSFRYQIHKNALTYGMALVIVATFLTISWPTSELRTRVSAEGWTAWLPVLREHLLTWHGLDQLVHADTMVFILGLTLFVAVISQTRLLEAVTFTVLRRYRGYVLPTVIAVTGVVAFASGILDGVSMIGLTIRTLVIVMFVASAPITTVRYAVMVCTVVTTVCGMWLAYGEPPNLIMKANLTAPGGESYLTNAFFLRYCLPSAIASYLVVAWNMRQRLRGTHVELNQMDILDAHVERIRFLQAARHGEVLTPIELLEAHEAELGEAVSERVQDRIRHGEPLGVALVHENVPPAIRQRLIGEFTSEELALSLDQYYVCVAAGDPTGAGNAMRAMTAAQQALAPRQVHAQRMGMVGLAIFIACLVWHAWDHHVPLFVSSFTGFVVSLFGILSIPKMRRLALHEARLEYAEYYFLFPLFLSMTLLTQVGFFEQLQELLKIGIARAGHGHVAFAQFLGCTFLSAILDNNVVADFGSRALLGLETAVLHLFAMAQIAGYATGGCWTHIGSAQSVVAFAFIKREVDERYTPVRWIREMTPVIIEIAVVLTLIIYVESALLSYLE